MNHTALVLPGGGARGAYQAGVLSRLGELAPQFEPSIITGVSAGAINAAFIANHSGSMPQAGRDLAQLWAGMRSEHVFATETPRLMRNFVNWGLQLVGGGEVNVDSARGMLDTRPLRRTLNAHLGQGDGELAGARAKLEAGRLQALAFTATSYRTGRAVTFAQGAASRPQAIWTRHYREGRPVRLDVDHVMASAAIPLLFPAVNVDGEWCGDGSVRQSAPLSPALHLGADRMLVIAASRPPREIVTDRDVYPSPARIAGVVLSSMMFDAIEFDTVYARRITELVRRSPTGHHELRPVDVVVLRPSVDLGLLAANYERALPKTLRYLIRGWGTRRSNSSDFLATLLFESAYTQQVIDIGRSDVDANWERLAAFVEAQDEPVSRLP